MSGRNAYVRPMTGWWLMNPFYVRYMVRESTSIFVALYAFILLAGLSSLAEGEAAWNAWLASLATPAAVSFHLLALAAALYHTVTWFKVSPKVAPPIFIGAKRLPDVVITSAQYVIAAAVYLILFVVAWS